MKLILASGSPRRAEILRTAGFAFDVIAPDVDETRIPAESASAYVRRLAEEKARTAAQLFASRESAVQAIVIGADTVVVADGLVLGKPASREDAREMLARLSGKVHEVHTGLALARLPRGHVHVFEEVTRVEFAEIAAGEISAYIVSGEPSDKAGAYAIQGLGGKFVKRIEGCYFNVMGLPLARLYAELRRLGWNSAAS